MNTLFKCCYVLILSLRESFLLLDSFEDLCGDYPEFVGLPVDEQQKLLKFRNAMKISLQLIDAKHHKGELLEICGRLSGKLVTTGGSQTTETKRRVLIYEREGGLESVDKKKRKNGTDMIKEEPTMKKTKTTSDCAMPLPTAVKIKSEFEGLLPPQVLSFITQQLQKSFSGSDVANYQHIVEKTLIQTTHNKELNRLTLRPILKELRKLFPRKEIWAEMNILFKCCYVLILSHRDDSVMWLSHEQFLNAYPYEEFSHLTVAETESLLVFRNALRLGLQLIDAKHHKGELLEIAGRLSGRVVTTGGGQTMDTTRCVMIYEQEGGISGTARKVKIERSTPAPVAEQATFAPEFAPQQMNFDAWTTLQPTTSLQRAMSDFSVLDKTFSFQSAGSLNLFGSIGNLADFALDLPLSSPETSSFAPAAVETKAAALRATPSPSARLSRSSSGRSQQSSNAKPAAPAAPAAKPVSTTTAGAAATAAGTPSKATGAGEQETDIDTELDSVEVATEVDEQENHTADEDDGAVGDEGPVSPQDCAELQDLLRSQTVADEPAEEENGLFCTLTMSSVLLQRTDTFAVGIGRLGSLRSINPESFAWSQ
jgi:hypothetical protein